jgi:hypothetical protein
MYCGMPLFDTWEKFLVLYAKRIKLSKDYVTEDVRLRGISLNYVSKLIFYPKENIWLTPSLKHCYDRDSMRVFIKRGYTFDSYFV